MGGEWDKSSKGMQPPRLLFHQLLFTFTPPSTAIRLSTPITGTTTTSELQTSSSAATTTTSTTSGCIFGEDSYNEGESVPHLCYHLICTSGIWVYTGVNNICREARVYWDPHVKTWDNTHYNYHKPCNFSLLQPGFAQSPTYGVYAQFGTCIGPGTCIEELVFKDNENTVITFLMSKTRGTSVFLNGKEFSVGGTAPSFMVQDGAQHPVLAWRQTPSGRSNRFFFAGSSKIVVGGLVGRGRVGGSARLGIGVRGGIGGGDVG
nr:uncharacterized protein LOC113799921 [Penaeus vannamei]